MLKKNSKYIDHIKIEFDEKFIKSLSLLTNKKIEPVIIDKDNKDIIIGIKCPVIMNEDTFDDDKKIVESDILKAFADLLNSEICNRKIKEKIYNKVTRKRKLEYIPFPCPVCGSTDTVGYGKRKTNIGIKHKRHCKKCDKTYTNQEDAIWKKKNSRQVMDEAIELSKQFSLRKTAQMIGEKYKIKISHSAIIIWRKNKLELLKDAENKK